MVTFTATLSPPSVNSEVPATSVTFKVGSQEMGTADLKEIGGVLTGTLTDVALLETVLGQMAPGSHTVTAVFNEVDTTHFEVTNPTTTLTITKELARVTYTGSYYVSTPSINENTAQVTLMATIQDITAVDSISDPDAGDIRKATVTFINKNGGATLGTANIPVSLINGDTKTGAVTTTFTATIPTNSNSVDYEVRIVVNNYYTNDEDGENEFDIVVSKPTPYFITGGGYLKLTDSSGQYAGEDLLKNNFGFEVKYNKKLTNPQGHVNIIVRKDGKVYQIKNTAIESLSVQPSSDRNPTGTATFISKANLVDVTNPLTPIPIGGNYKLQMTITDKGEPGSNDSIGMTLWDGTKLLFSSNWNGAKTIEQTLGGGNLAIH